MLQHEQERANKGVSESLRNLMWHNNHFNSIISLEAKIIIENKIRQIVQRCRLNICAVSVCVLFYTALQGLDALGRTCPGSPIVSL